MEGAVDVWTLVGDPMTSKDLQPLLSVLSPDNGIRLIDLIQWQVRRGYRLATLTLVLGLSAGALFGIFVGRTL